MPLHEAKAVITFVHSESLPANQQVVFSLQRENPTGSQTTSQVDLRERRAQNRFQGEQGDVLLIKRNFLPQLLSQSKTNIRLIFTAVYRAVFSLAIFSLLLPTGSV